VITAFGSMDAAVEALKAGAYDFVSKPVDLAKLRDLVQTALKLSQKTDIGESLNSDIATSDDSNPIIGTSPAIEQFLDEVADLPLSMQVKLLRAIQEKAVKAVGGVEEVGVDTRILSATHKNLEQEVEKGNFRQDLYYRLNVIKLDVPSLEARGDDILLLAEHFLELIAERWQMPKAKLSNKSIEHLSNYSFPGNVRELENILERACTLADGEYIEPSDLQLSATNIDMSQPRLDIPQLRYRIKKYELDQTI